MHRPRGQRRRGFLELGQGGPVRSGDFRRQRGLEDGQRLAELHRAALEFAQDAEDLLGGALLDLCGDDLGGTAAESLAQPERGPAGHAGREGGQLGGPGHGTPGEIIHSPILGQDAERLLQRHRGCGTQLRRRHCQSGSTSSSVPLITTAAVAAWSTKASACAVAWAATAAASAAAHPAGCAARPDVWARMSGQAGSRSLRAMSTQLRQAVRPGRTSGPTTPIASGVAAVRCAISPATRVAGNSGG